MSIDKEELIEELFFSKKRTLIDNELKNIIEKNITDKNLKDDIFYHFGLDIDILPTLNHSKRLRSYLCLTIAEENNFNIKEISPLAITVELMHNTTLIIDDIQDNDTIRCGRESLWKKVGINRALQVILALSNLTHTYYNEAVINNKFANYNQDFFSIFDNLVSGQQMDIMNKVNNKQDYEKMVSGKTGQLIFLALIMGSCPYKKDNTKFDTIKKFSINFAILYQLIDDIKDNEYIINNIFETKSDIENFKNKKYSDLLFLFNKLVQLKILKTDKLKQVINIFLEDCAI